MKVSKLSAGGREHILHIEFAVCFEQTGSFADSEGLTQEVFLAGLTACQGKRREAARQLGIGLRTLYTRLREYGISTDQDEEK